jgi:hypothetical protein
MHTKSWMVMSAVVVGLSLGPAARAEEPAHGHEHEHGAAGKDAPALVLDHGKKWPTSEPLRTGMTAIRDELQAALEPIHAKTYSPADYQALAGRIEAQATKIITTCKLPPEVDAQYHLVLAQLFAGTEQMKKDGDRMGGAVKLVKALKAYGDFFDHAGWKPIQH